MNRTEMTSSRLESNICGPHFSTTYFLSSMYEGALPCALNRSQSPCKQVWKASAPERPWLQCRFFKARVRALGLSACEDSGGALLARPFDLEGWLGVVYIIRSSSGGNLGGMINGACCPPGASFLKTEGLESAFLTCLKSCLVSIF